MRISVLMSLYEKEKPEYFERSLKSIWEDQVRKPDEIVLVEDGPVPQELEDVVTRWQTKVLSFKVVRLEKNQGLPVALNEGAKHCNCDYVARMDTDDISLPERFLWQEEYLLKHPEIAVLGGGVIEFSDEEGDMKPRMMPQSTKEIKDAIVKTCPFIHPTVCIKKELFEKGIEYNPKSRKFQDLEYWFKILAAGYEMANMNKIVLRFRKDPFMYQKRNNAAKMELGIMFRGIYSLYGVTTWKYFYPIIHYLYRLLPPKVCLFIYKNFIIKYWEKKNTQ